MIKNTHPKNGRGGVQELVSQIQKTFADFDVHLEVVSAEEGVRTFYFTFKTVKPVRMKTIKSFEEDLRYALGNSKLEIQAPIPDEVLIGITLPKKEEVKPVALKNLLESPEYLKHEGRLVVPFGVDDHWEKKVYDLTKFPHLLIGGTTGSGKSNLLHLIINSLINTHGPDHLRFLLADSSRVSFGVYKKLPHLLTETISDPKKFIIALKWCIKEMERRLDVLGEAGVMNIGEYHDAQKKKGNEFEPMPYIVVVVDELADFFAAYPKEIEACIIRLAQMSRAVGIHLVLSTQRPSVNIITGLVKANIPARVAFRVASVYDSRTILDLTGAEKLNGSGDALAWVDMNDSLPVRTQMAHVATTEIKTRVKRWLDADAQDRIALSHDDSTKSVFDKFIGGDDEDYDDMYEIAEEAVLEAGKASTSFLQRRLRIGYSRAARLIDMLEEKGVIGPGEGATPRAVTQEFVKKKKKK